MIHRFLYRCFWIYLDWDKFRFELVKVNGCLQEQRLSWELYFFFWCFLITNKGIQEKLITGPKKPLFSVLPYLGSLPLQTRTKLRKSLKGILHRCKLQIVCKSLSKLSNAFVWEIAFQKNLHLVSLIRISEDSAMNLLWWICKTLM